MTVKYGCFQQDELPGDGGEARERNAARRELARVQAWHATFNAALPAIIGLGFGAVAEKVVSRAAEIADAAHGKID